MNTYTFVKTKTGWSINFPDYIQKGGNESDLNMINGAEAMLNLLAEGSSEVTLTLTKEPFDNADVLHLLQPCQPFLNGGYYVLNHYNGKEINYEMWLCDVPRFVFGDTPEKIYVKKQPPALRD